MSKKITVPCRYGHKNQNTKYLAEPTPYYCPHCGSNGTVYIEAGEGDYYCGPSSVCIFCDARFSLPGGIDIQTDEAEKIHMYTLRAAVKGRSK